jgi:HSP20 family protein
MMNLIKWNPRKEMETFSDHINRFFDGGMFPSTWLSEVSSLDNWKPVADIFEQDDKIVIKAELPGVDKKDIRVDLKDNVLSLEGERSSDNEVKEENFYRRERVHGTFSRSFMLPKGLHPEKIKADFKDGVLNIEIPKPEEIKAKKITVQ